VRDDQPQDGRADRQHGEDKEANPIQGIRQHPEVRGDEREDDRRCGGRQCPHESNDQAPGPVGTDHAGQEPHVPAHHRSDETEIDVVVRRFDRADRCRHRRDPVADPRAPPRATLAELEALADQPVHEPDDRVARPTSSLYRPERRQRDQCHPVRGTGVRDDRTCCDAQRSVGDADGHIPALAEQARTPEVDGLDTVTHVRHREVGPHRDAPRDHVGHAVREQPGQVFSQRFGDLRGPPRSRQQAQHQLVAIRRRHVRDVTRPVPCPPMLRLRDLGGITLGHVRG
jgi:hypothetical protein